MHIMYTNYVQNCNVVHILYMFRTQNHSFYIFLYTKVYIVCIQNMYKIALFVYIICTKYIQFSYIKRIYPQNTKFKQVV